MDMFDVAVPTSLVTDSFSNIAVFLAALEGVTSGRHLHVASRELASVPGLLLLSLTLDEHVLGDPGLSRELTGIAGGIILFAIVVRLIFPPLQGLLDEMPDGESLLVPLATPAVAGPSALAMLITLHIAFDGPSWELYLAVVLAWVATALVLLQAALLQRFLGLRGLTAIKCLTGMPLITLSVDMLLDNLRSVSYTVA